MTNKYPPKHNEQCSFSFLQGELDNDNQQKVIPSKKQDVLQKNDGKCLESLGVLAGGIAHDFNNLLSVILGNVSLANRHISSPEQLEIYLSRIEQASTNAAGLCKQMLAYAGQGNFTFKAIDLASTVYDMSKLLEMSLFKHVRIQYQLSDDLPYTKVDTAQIQQVIMNLITNANEAMKDNQHGMISVRVDRMQVDANTATITGQDVEAGEYIYIEVTDEGCGMSEETKARIFEPFFTTKFTGNGLGMSAMLGIVRGHSGMIQLKSELGKGSSFRVAFPAANKQTNQDDTMNEEYDALSKFQPSGKMLLVDDEDIVLETMQVMLEDLGYRSIVAKDGLEAIELYKKHQQEIDMVLMDMTMPRMGGKACVEELQKLNPDVKIILSSGYTEEDISPQFKETALAGFLQKPCSLKQLYHAIKRVL